MEKSIKNNQSRETVRKELIEELKKANARKSTNQEDTEELKTLRETIQHRFLLTAQDVFTISNNLLRANPWPGDRIIQGSREKVWSGPRIVFAFSLFLAMCGFSVYVIVKLVAFLT